MAHELARDGVSNLLSIEDILQGLSARLEACLLLLKLAPKQGGLFHLVAQDSCCVAELARWAAEATETAGTVTGVPTVTSSSSSDRPVATTRQWAFSNTDLQQLRKKALSQQEEQVVWPAGTSSTSGDDPLQLPPCPQLLAPLVLARCLIRPDSHEPPAAGALLQLFMRCLQAGSQCMVLDLTRLLLRVSSGTGPAGGTRQQPLLLCHPQALQGLLHLAMQPAQTEQVVSGLTGSQQALAEVLAGVQLDGPLVALWEQLLQMARRGVPEAFATLRVLMSPPQLSEAVVTGSLLPAVVEGAGAALAAGGVRELFEAGWVLLPLVTTCRPRVSTGTAAAEQCEALLGRMVLSLLQQHSSCHEAWDLASAVISARSCVLTAVPEMTAVIATCLQQAMAAKVEGEDLDLGLVDVCLQLHGDGACWDLVMVDEACLAAVAAAVCSSRDVGPQQFSLLQELCSQPRGLLAVVTTSQAICEFCSGAHNDDDAQGLWSCIQYADGEVVSAFLQGLAAGSWGHWWLVAVVWADGDLQGPGLGMAAIITALVQGWPVVQDAIGACRMLPHLLQQEIFIEALRRDASLQLAVASAVLKAGWRAEAEVVEVLLGPHQQLLVASPAAVACVVEACCTYHCHTDASSQAVQWVADLEQTQQVLLGDSELLARCLSTLYVHHRGVGCLPDGSGVLVVLEALPASQLAPLLVQHFASNTRSVVQGALQALYWLSLKQHAQEVVTQNVQRTAQRAAQMEELAQLTLGLQQAAVELAQLQVARLPQ